MVVPERKLHCSKNSSSGIFAKGSTTHDEMVKYFLFELRKSTKCLHVARQPAACISQQAVSVLGEQLMLREFRRSFRES